ncbi:hypothetical protein Tsubulata_015198 [Turnera subulata]|uniref:Uncharacterized protein n=1 Tax=Turnera subulata TaxID=218843 RepID=A0A9Q0J2K2_9ROSI|nr:hypothetical protein Tsubulata_015198 [Turnera subulata]
MMCWYRLQWHTLLVTLIYIASSPSLPFALCAPHHFQPFLALPPAAGPGGRANGGEYEVDLLWGTRRSAVEGPIAEPVENANSPLVLAPRRTYRKDPLNGFKKYTGGWNISNHHYWASVGYTAAPLFVIAAIWFLVFGLSLLLLSICYFCCKKQAHGYSRIAYALSLVFLILFSLGAIIGCIVLYTAQGRFHSSTKETLEYVVNQADDTVGKLRTISDYIASAKLVGVDQVFLPSNVQTDIDQIQARINSSISIVADKTEDNADDIRDLLDSMRLALITISAIMLLLTFLGLLFSIFGMQSLVYILVVLGWILVAGTFILSGTFLLIHNSGEVDFNNATEVWSSYVCQVSPTGICSTTGRLTPTFFDQMTAAVNVSYALYNDGPFLSELQDCTFARETFEEIYTNHCPHIGLYSRWIYIGLVMVSTAVMLSLIFWVIYGRERRHRGYKKQLLRQVMQGDKRSS